MNSEIITALIAAGTTLITSIGALHVTMKQYRAKNEELVNQAITDVKDSMTENIGQIQLHLVGMDADLKNLTEKVEHDSRVIESMQQLQSEVRINARDIEHLREMMA